MKPKTQIEIGRWTAIILVIGALANILIVLFGFRNNISDPIFLHGLTRAIWPIIFSNGSCVLFFAGLAFTIGRRLFRVSLFLLICFVLLITWCHLRVDYFDPFHDPFEILFELFCIFLLSQGVFGIYKERHTVKDDK